MKRLTAVLMCLATAPLSAQPAVARLSVTQELRIDGATEDLSGATSVIIGPQGRIIFVEPQDFRIRFYSAAGKEITRFGRRGQGPGEFDLGNQIRPIAASVTLGTMGDTIWAWDRGTRRFTLISADGRMIQSVPPPAKLPSMSGELPPESGAQRVLLSFEPRAVFRDGSMLGRTGWGFVETVKRPDGQQVPSSRAAESGYAVATAAGDITRVIAISPPAKNFADVSRGPGMGGVGSAIPFVEPLYETMSQDGSRIAYGITTITSQQAGALKVVVIGMRGDTLVNRNFLFTPVALAKRTTDSAVAEIMKRYRPSAESKSPPPVTSQMADEMESKLRAGIPVGRSVYRGLSLGIDNSIWIALPNSTDGGRQYLVLDERGNPYGMVPWPRNATLARASLSTVWAIEHDADGLPSIVRYRITRDS